jgi:hypothetical protein
VYEVLSTPDRAAARLIVAAISRAYMGVQDVADRYGVSSWTVYDLCRAGRLPHRKLPARRDLMFLEAELDAYDDGAELEVIRRGAGGRVVRPRGRAKEPRHGN